MTCFSLRPCCSQRPNLHWGGGMSPVILTPVAGWRERIALPYRGKKEELYTWPLLVQCWPHLPDMANRQRHSPGPWQRSGRPCSPDFLWASWSSAPAPFRNFFERSCGWIAEWLPVEIGILHILRCTFQDLEQERVTQMSKCHSAT